MYPISNGSFVGRSGRRYDNQRDASWDSPYVRVDHTMFYVRDGITYSKKYKLSWPWPVDGFDQRHAYAVMEGEVQFQDWLREQDKIKTP